MSKKKSPSSELCTKRCAWRTFGPQAGLPGETDEAGHPLTFKGLALVPVGCCYPKILLVFVSPLPSGFQPRRMRASLLSDLEGEAIVVAEDQLVRCVDMCAEASRAGYAYLMVEEPRREQSIEAKRGNVTFFLSDTLSSSI